MPCGDVPLKLAFSDFNHKGRGTTIGAISGPVAYSLETVTIAHGSTTEVTVDVAPWMPGRVTLEVLEASQPVRDAFVEFEPVRSLRTALPKPTTAGMRVSRRIVKLTDEKGRAMFPVVPHGAWRIRVREANWLWTTELETLTVEPGSETRLTSALRLAKGTVTVVDAVTGAAQGAREVWLEPRSGVRVLRRTDEYVQVALRLGPGLYRVFATETAEQPAATLEWGPAGAVDPVLRM